MIFFHVRDFHLYFISSNLIFSASIVWSSPVFVLTLKRVHGLLFSLFSARQIFFLASYCRWKFQFSDCVNGKGYTFEFVFTVDLQMLMSLHLSTEHQSVGLRVVIVFAKINFAASYRRKKKKAAFFKFLRNIFDIRRCTVLFFTLTLIFY